MKLNQLESAILATLIWFDMFQWPLKLEELWQYLYLFDDKEDGLFKESFKETKPGLESIRQVLKKNENLKKIVESRGEFYFLKGKSDLVRLRQERENISSKKIKKAKRIVRLLSLVPFVKMISLSNIMGKNNFSEESDLDFFIITSKNRIWTTRFFTVSLVETLGLRPRFNYRKDKACLNFFLSEDNLSLESMALRPYDIYLTYWIHQLIPFCDKDETYKKFLKANDWTRKYLPNIVDRSNLINFWQEKGLPPKKGFLERFLCYLQLKLMPKILKEKAKEDPQAVIISDKKLKFHIQERREKYREKFEKQFKIISGNWC